MVSKRTKKEQKLLTKKTTNNLHQIHNKKSQLLKHKEPTRKAKEKIFLQKSIIYFFKNTKYFLYYISQNAPEYT